MLRYHALSIYFHSTPMVFHSSRFLNKQKPKEKAIAPGACARSYRLTFNRIINPRSLAPRPFLLYAVKLKLGPESCVSLQDDVLLMSRLLNLEAACYHQTETLPSSAVLKKIASPLACKDAGKETKNNLLNKLMMFGCCWTTRTCGSFVCFLLGVLFVYAEAITLDDSKCIWVGIMDVKMESIMLKISDTRINTICLHQHLLTSIISKYWHPEYHIYIRCQWDIKQFSQRLTSYWKLIANRAICFHLVSSLFLVAKQTLSKERCSSVMF